jgi:hypothetical protein
MVVLPSNGASLYYNCCVDGGTRPEYFGYHLVLVYSDRRFYIVSLKILYHCVPTHFEVILKKLNYLRFQAAFIDTEMFLSIRSMMRWFSLISLSPSLSRYITGIIRVYLK